MGHCGGNISYVRYSGVVVSVVSTATVYGEPTELRWLYRIIEFRVPSAGTPLLLPVQTWKVAAGTSRSVHDYKCQLPQCTGPGFVDGGSMSLRILGAPTNFVSSVTLHYLQQAAVFKTDPTRCWVAVVSHHTVCRRIFDLRHGAISSGLHITMILCNIFWAWSQGVITTTCMEEALVRPRLWLVLAYPVLVPVAFHLFILFTALRPYKRSTATSCTHLTNVEHVAFMCSFLQLSIQYPVYSRVGMIECLSSASLKIYINAMVL
jgi:hypothetical protein